MFYSIAHKDRRYKISTRANPGQTKFYLPTIFLVKEHAPIYNAGKWWLKAIHCVWLKSRIIFSVEERTGAFPND